MKIVFLDTNTMGEDISLSPISSLGEFTGYFTSTPEEALERVTDCDVLIVNKVKVTRELMDAAKRLKLICVAATGVNNVDLDYAESKGIPVRNAVDYSTESVAQFTMMQLLALNGRSQELSQYVRSGAYSASNSFTNVEIAYGELKGKTLGIIGLGHIGRRVAEMATVFGMKIIYYSASGNAHCPLYECVDLETLLTHSDVVSIHSPLTEKTRGLISYEKISLMKPSSLLLNMGRGGIVVEKDLARALDEGIITGAAVDVFESEPLPGDHPYLTMSRGERLLLSPHAAWASREARVKLVEKIAGNIMAMKG